MKHLISTNNKVMIENDENIKTPVIRILEDVKVKEYKLDVIMLSPADYTVIPANPFIPLMPMVHKKGNSQSITLRFTEETSLHKGDAFFIIELVEPKTDIEEDIKPYVEAFPNIKFTLDGSSYKMDAKEDGPIDFTVIPSSPEFSVYINADAPVGAVVVNPLMEGVRGVHPLHNDPITIQELFQGIELFHGIENPVSDYDVVPYSDVAEFLKKENDSEEHKGLRVVK